MIDTHAHLEMCEGTPEQAVTAAAAAGVSRILAVGREQAIGFAQRFPGVWAVAGWHPHEAGEVADVSALLPLLDQPRVVAVGECGLDFYRDYAPRDDQVRVFAEQILIANRLGLPLVIHTRAADVETFRMLESASVPVVLHCFGSVDLLDDAIARGYHCSFAGNVTFPRAADLRAAAARVPEQLLLAETDSPYLAPVPRRGRPNQPANVVHILDCLAQLRGVASDRLADAIDRNASRVFGLP